MELTDTTLLAALIASGAVSLLAVALAAASLRSQRRLRRAYHAVLDGRTDDVLVVLQRALAELDGLRGDVDQLRAYAASLRDHDRGAVSRVGTVRYDAFDDLGGMLSFSTALLDEHGDGVVLTAINGRDHTRMYAKALQGGDSQHNLSDEEREAITRAQASSGALGEPPTPAGSGPARRRQQPGARQGSRRAGHAPDPQPERAPSRAERSTPPSQPAREVGQ